MRTEIGCQDRLYRKKICIIRRHNSDSGGEVGAAMGSSNAERYKMQSASHVISIVLIAIAPRAFPRQHIFIVIDLNIESLVSFH
jgi:hypothetical protein